MSLDLINNLINTIKERDFIQSFINELKEYFNNKDITNTEKDTNLDVDENITSSERNEVSLIEQTLENEIVTTVCRDKMYAARGNILKECFEKASEKGTLYYIYSKNSLKEDTYSRALYGDGICEHSGEISEDALPEGAGVDSVLRLVNGEYVLDIEATEYVREEMEKAIAELLEEQEQLLDSYRVEGHIYKVVEICNSHNVTLRDLTLNTSRCFQETDIPSLVLENITRRKFNSICKWRIYFILISSPVFSSYIVNCNSWLNVI